MTAIGQDGLEPSSPSSITRECGNCTLCCKLLGVKELSKPQGQWCEHCAVGVGCKVYDTRPAECRHFTCMWLAGMIAEELTPDKVRRVFTVTNNRVTVDVDPHRPDAYKTGVVRDCINRCTAKGQVVVISIGTEKVVASAHGLSEVELSELAHA